MRSRLGCVFPALAAAAPLAFAPAAAQAEERRRLSLEFTQTTDALAVVEGGLEQGGALLHKFDLIADWQSGPFQAHLDLQYVGGDDLSGDLVGDAQVVSNIEAPDALRVLEAWVARSFANGRAGLKAGLVDLNTEFDVQSVGAVFLNSSHGVGPDLSQTGLAGPSIFPNTSLAVTGFAEVANGWTVRGGLFDAAPGDPDDPRRILVRLSGEEGALGIVEVERRLTERGRLKLGAWAYSAAFEAIERVGPAGEPLEVKGNRGVYAILEGQLTGEAGYPEQGLSAWVRVGGADAEINPIRLYLGGGAVYTGLLREDDQLGVAIGHARFGGPARRTFGLREAETVAELTYAWPVSENVSIQPDLQYVWAPGGDPNIPDALVVGVRFSLTAPLRRAAQ